MGDVLQVSLSIIIPWYPAGNVRVRIGFFLNKSVPCLHELASRPIVRVFVFSSWPFLPQCIKQFKKFLSWKWLDHLKTSLATFWSSITIYTRFRMLQYIKKRYVLLNTYAARSGAKRFPKILSAERGFYDTCGKKYTLSRVSCCKKQYILGAALSQLEDWVQPWDSGEKSPCF